MEVLHGFPEWVVAVIEHWHGWLSGGILAFALELGDRLWDWKPKRSVFITILGVGLLWSVFAAWRDEHHNTEVVISEKAAAWSQYNQCDKERFSKVLLNDQYVGQIKDQRGRIDSQQGTVDSLQGTIVKQQVTVDGCVVALTKINTPETQRFHIASGPVSTDPKQSKHSKLIMLTTNKAITPVNFHVGCKGEIKWISPTVLGVPFFSGEAVPSGSGTYFVTMTTPPIDQDHPLLLWVGFDADDLEPCTFTPQP